VAIAQFRLGHLDGTLMMWCHHRNEVIVDVTGIPMSIIIFVIALTFSAKNGFRRENAAVQIAAM
jgi:hypothetical protein